MNSLSRKKSLVGRWQTFTLWGALVGVFFFTIYPTTNWFANIRHQHYSLFLCAELRIPFYPIFIWPYLSMYGLFLLPPFFLGPYRLKQLAKNLIVLTCVAGVSFVLFPADLGFQRILPSDHFYRSLYSTLFAVDYPHNLVPSLHVVYSTTITLAIVDKVGNHLRCCLLGWLFLLVISTLFVHQHHLIDLVSGIILSVCIHQLRREADD